MQIFHIDLNPDYKTAGIPEPKKKINFIGYVLKNYDYCETRKRPAVIICPGGGYTFTSEREATPVALEFLSRGINAFVLHYTTAPSGYFPSALLEAFSAVAYVRKNAAEFHIDENKIYICGFSAGGHAAASTGVFWNHPIAQELGFSGAQHRPDGMILCYPVITGGKFAHRSSFENLLGEQYSDTTVELTSLENRVNRETPRTFLWHTYADDSVPVENAFLFADRLVENKVEVEMHIYPKGKHGLSTAKEEVTTAGFEVDERTRRSLVTWVEYAAEFVKE